MAENEIVKHVEAAYKVAKDPEKHWLHKLKEILIEILIIVFAVSLSIWFHNWSDSLHEHKEEREFLVGLQKDIRADLEDAQIRCGTSASRVAALRLYDAGQQRWMLYSATQAGGLATGLPQVGRFDASGNGVFVSTATLDGRAVLIRQRWSAREGHPYFERAFSFDGGRTWRTNWTVDYLRRAG